MWIMTGMDSMHGLVVSRLRALGPSKWHEVALRSGVPYGTVYKVAYRYTQSPRFKTIEALSRALNEPEAA